MANVYDIYSDGYLSFWEVMHDYSKWLIEYFAVDAINAAMYAFAGCWPYILSPHHKSNVAKAAPAQNISAEADTVERLKNMNSF